MSEFFNPKEDVIDLELTQYGKYLLSKGEMRPYFYAFYDDDILYDGACAGLDEPPHSSHSRIKDETPRTKAQYVFSGIETEIKRINKLITSNLAELGSEQVQPTADKANALPMPLGTSGPNTNKSPAWNLFLGKAQITSSLTHISASNNNVPLVNIPQLDVYYTATTRVGYDDDPDVAETVLNITPPTEKRSEAIRQAEEDFESRVLQAPYEYSISNPLDGYHYYVEHDFVFADVKEENCPNLKENFDIEVYEVNNEYDKATGKTKEVLRQLKFYPTPDNITNLSQTDALSIGFPKLTPEYVEYYFDLLVDQEIEDHILCQVDFKNKKENIFVDSLLEYECAPSVSTRVSYGGPGVGDPCE